MNIGNAKILFCCKALSAKDAKATAAKPNQPEIIKPEPETKPAEGSIYSGITGAIYNLANDITGWFSGGGKNDKDDDKKH